MYPVRPLNHVYGYNTSNIQSNSTIFPSINSNFDSPSTLTPTTLIESTSLTIKFIVHQ